MSSSSSLSSEEFFSFHGSSESWPFLFPTSFGRDILQRPQPLGTSQISGPDALLSGIDVLREEHRQNLVHTAHLSFKEGLYTDVVLVVGDRRFHTHRLILAALSDFFQTLFKPGESRVGEVTLHGVVPEDFALVLEFAYTGMLDLTPENVQGILLTADYLNISGVSRECQLFMARNLDFDNVSDVLRFARHYSLQLLEKLSTEFLCRSLEPVSASDGFIEFDVEVFVTFLEKDDLVLYDGYEVLKSKDREELLLRTVLNYVFKANLQRKRIEQLIDAVRLPCMPEETVHECFQISPFLQDIYHDHYKDLSETARMYLNKDMQAGGKAPDGIPRLWLSRRKLAAVCTVLGRRYAAGAQMGRFREAPLYLYNSQHIEISQIDIWIRRWDRRPVLGGLEITYRGGDARCGGGFEHDKLGSYSKGGRKDSWERHRVSLRPEERIVSVTISSSDWAVDRIGFVTTAGRTLGPFGGEGGTERLEEAPEAAESYLHDINCDTVDTAQGEVNVVNLVLRWITFD